LLRKKDSWSNTAVKLKKKTLKEVPYTRLPQLRTGVVGSFQFDLPYPMHSAGNQRLNTYSVFTWTIDATHGKNVLGGQGTID
jgi:hypothetical protein